MEGELKLLKDNGTWVLTNLPPGQKALKSKWLWKMKFNAINGCLTKFKARLVLKGYMQRHGVDYFELFTPVLRINALRLLLCLAALHDWSVRQLDVKTAFLNGILDADTEIFMEQPPNYAERGLESKACRLIKSLYGLKQAPRCWYLTLHTSLLSIGFARVPRKCACTSNEWEE
jgi:Reverse transcriptase (RNA-dependent DNA polymerase)